MKNLLFIVSVFYVGIQVNPLWAQQNCQCPGNAIHVGSNYQSVTDITTTPIPSDAGPNSAICLRGTLRINRTQKFGPGCQIFMGDRAKIVVTTGYTFTSDQSVYCAWENVMYYGIELNSGSSLKFTGNEVYDAYYGINAKSGSRILSMGGNTFDRNHIGLRFIEPNLSIATIEENQFLCNGSLIDDLISPTTPFLTLCGIYLMRNNANIISCKFDGLINGINAQLNATLSVQYSDFSNLLPLLSTPTLTYDVAQGFAIYLGNNSVANNINHCDVAIAAVGIRTSNSTLRDVYNVTMAHVEVGILEEAQRGVSHIHENTISFQYRGMWMRNARPGFYPELIENNFTTNMELLFGGERYGILLEGISSNASVIDNTMDLDNGCNGIRTRNTSATNISLNEINYSRLRSGPVAIFEAAGIAIQNNGSAYLVGNTINSSGYDGRLDRGITASLSQGALYCCNTTDGNLKYSIRFTNNCDRSKYRYNNKQGNYFNGLFIENGSFFGPQPDPRSGPLSPSGNLWEGSLANEPGPKAHARNANSTPSNRFRSIIFTDGCNPPAWPTTILPTQPCGPGFWLNPLTGEFPSQSCLQDPACHIPSVGLRNNPEHYITASDEEIAIGTLDIEVFGAVAEWQGKLYLLKKLIMYPELLGAVTQIDSFYDVNINLNLGKFVNAYNLIFNEASISLSQIATLENLNSIANNLLIELNDLQLAYNNATTEAEQDQLAAEIVLFQAELDLNRTEYFTELAGMLDQQQSFKSSIETILSSITPLGIIQENEKTILALITEFLINDNQNFSTTQISDLQNVANQCPQTGGAIVYWARIILSSFIAETYDDETLCNTMGNLKGVENPSNGNLKHLFKITQNSTQDELILMSEDLYEGLLNVELLSILGNSPLRVWKKVQFNQALSLEGFPTGYYILRVTEENGKSHSFKWINF